MSFESDMQRISKGIATVTVLSGIAALVVLPVFLHREYQAEKRLDARVIQRFTETCSTQSNSEHYREELEAFVYGKIPSSSKYNSQEKLMDLVLEGRRYRNNLKRE